MFLIAAAVPDVEQRGRRGRSTGVRLVFRRPRKRSWPDAAREDVNVSNVRPFHFARPCAVQTHMRPSWSSNRHCTLSDGRPSRVEKRVSAPFCNRKTPGGVGPDPQRVPAILDELRDPHVGQSVTPPDSPTVVKRTPSNLDQSCLRAQPQIAVVRLQ